MKTFIRFYFILVFTCLFLIAQVCMAVDDTLVLHFTFDEGAGKVVTDDSIYLNNGNFKANPKWVDGKFGKALSFNAGDSVEIPGSDSLDITKAITMEMWVKLSGGAEIKQAGIEKGGWEVGEYSIYPVYEGGTAIQFFDLPGACGDAAIRGKSIQDGEWHYFAGTWDGSYMRVYVDCQKEGEVAWTCPPASTTNNLGIGKRLSGWGGYMPFLGNIDEVRIYSSGRKCGDVNADGTINVNDVVYLINYLFVPGSPAPIPLLAGDANCDGAVNVNDVVYLINFLFISGPPPCY